MLKRLSIKNVALIERLNMDFDDGFNVLTGETGAGKSIIIDAVNLALGERASKELIKTGAEKASVEAEFSVSENAAIKAVLEENELDWEDDLIISREISLSGKNVCRINGTLVNLATLKQITDLLVDVHGQHQHQSLIIQSRHIGFLDAFAHSSIDALKECVSKVFSEYKSIRSELMGGFQSEDERIREMDILRYQVNEIEKAELTEAEEESLLEQRGVLMNAERIMSALEESYSALSGEGGAVEKLGEACMAMQGIAHLAGDYDAAHKKLSEVYYALEDAGIAVRELRNSFEFEPGRIDEIEQRLEVYSNLKKKYGPDIDSVNRFYETSKERLETLENAAERREKLNKELGAKEKEYLSAAAALTEARRTASASLEKELLSQLADLGMEKARFEVYFTALDNYTANGTDKVEFMLSANPGESLKPLEKVASGGEMSRIMLAFKAIAAHCDMIPTLIFDEIDTGISGHIASVVGNKMVNISDTHQVLCVTHLPQIAALADVHYIVEKSDDGTVTRSEVRKLTLEQRCEYIAKMMSGMDNSEIALQHSRELISHSEEVKKKRRGR